MKKEREGGEKEIIHELEEWIRREKYSILSIPFTKDYDRGSMSTLRKLDRFVKLLKKKI